MKELSMHVYDLMENSTAANSTLVELTIKDSLKDNIYAFTIKDNGFGQGDRPLDHLTHHTQGRPRPAAHQDEHRERWRWHED